MSKTIERAIEYRASSRVTINHNGWSYIAAVNGENIAEFRSSCNPAAREQAIAEAERHGEIDWNNSNIEQ